MIQFPCTSDEMMKALPKKSTIKISIEPNVWKSHGLRYVDKELPTRFVASFPHRPNRFGSWKDFMSSLKKNSEYLIVFENLRRREYFDEQRSDELRSFTRLASSVSQR